MDYTKKRTTASISITELSPVNGAFVGKHINRDGSIEQYPNVTWWRQAVATIPATIPRLFDYMCEARGRNICLIRGAPADIKRVKTRRQIAGRGERGDHGFLDEPSRLLSLDPDGVEMNWMAGPEGAVRSIVAKLREPWSSASFVWFFSATHGLERDAQKRWTGRVVDGSVRLRLMFITDRDITSAEATALTNIARTSAPELKLDPAISRTVQPNYIRRPHWIEHPDRDVLGDIPTIGWVEGEHEHLAVPDDLVETARWAGAQGHDTDIADHPDAESAVRAIGSDGRVRRHIQAAVVHLLEANPIPPVSRYEAHSREITCKLAGMIEQHRAAINADVDGILQNINPRFALWRLEHQSMLNRKTIKLVKEESGPPPKLATKDEMLRRVEETVARVRVGDGGNVWINYGNKAQELPLQEVLPAPTGSTKSTQIRANAVRFVEENPKKSVVILIPRHALGAEQIERLHREHPGRNFSAAVWRGRHADDPEAPGEKMCRRSEEAIELERALIDVETHLCRQGQGEKMVVCPLFELCGTQRQKQTRANIWFGAHELMVHEMPKAFGDVGWVIIDESPLDAFMMGIDINSKMTLQLDALRVPPPVSFPGDSQLMLAREVLYEVLHKLPVPNDPHKGVPVSRELLIPFFDTWNGSADVIRWHDPNEMARLEWQGKIKAKITPNMSKEEVQEAVAGVGSNVVLFKHVMLWKLIAGIKEGERCGRIQVHRGSNGGREIRMVGMRPVAGSWQVQTLICDATADKELLQYIWPGLVGGGHWQGWQQLPRPKSVRVLQCVDRAFAKFAIAVEGKTDLERKTDAAQRVYASILMKALEYGGADVGAIIYKSTREWIEKNCYVPPWLKLMHWGSVTGTNELEHVRALFVVGRPLASPDAVALQTDALIGGYVADRAYMTRRKHGRIPIVPNAKGLNTIKVDVREMADAMAQRVARQITVAAIIQAVGRARAGIRADNEPLDIHLWTDVPVPELGPVEPVLWKEVEADLDGLMLATGGVWLENAHHAAQAYPDLLTVEGLRKSRSRGGRTILIGTPISNVLPPRLTYQLAGAGQKPTTAIALIGTTSTRVWLEKQLGALAWFEVEGMAGASE